MKIGVILLNFGEPEHATEREVVPFLERIFVTNALLEGNVSTEQALARSAELARRRAPALIETYERIGGSPLNAQARAQADALQNDLAARGRDVIVQAAMQFTEPSIAVVVRRMRAEGVQQIVGLPVYPLCGQSTTVAALSSLELAIAHEKWHVDLVQISGWHTHALYTAMRAEGIRRLVAKNDLDLADGAVLVFSAHGTPVKYVLEGSRYDLYVRDSCSRIAQAAGVARYVVGYQNHTNRPVEWTQPEIGDVVRALNAESIVVVPVSFMHEQSETLAELDTDLREQAEGLGKSFFRVPIPHDDPRFARILGDVVEGALRGELLRCRCRIGAGCLAANI